MGQESSSRLQRLLTLLDTGSSQATRFAAARQIGEISKLNHQDLTSLLRKVSHYLHSKSWDTRVAAAHAIGSISENVKHTSLSELVTRIRNKMLRSGVYASDDDVISWLNFHSSYIVGTFRSFDMIKVLDFGALLASGGQEYDVVNDIAKNPKERLAHQKRNLRRRLGLDVCERFMDIGDIFKDEDLLACKYGNGTSHVGYRSGSPHDIRQLVANAIPGFMDKRPSSRELNLLKRKAKISFKDQNKGWQENGELDAPLLENSASSKGLSKGFTQTLSGSDKMQYFSVASPEFNREHGGADQWPFNNFVDQLLLDIFDPVWEIRHGSSMALREILTSQGASAGMYTPDWSSDTSSVVGERINSDICAMKSEDSDELERASKKPKLEAVVGVTNHGNFPNVSGDGLSIAVNIDRKDASDSLYNIEEVGPNDGADTCNETRLDANPGGHEDKVSGLLTDDTPIAKMDALNRDPLLMNLVELTRSSWFRNCEILQDCAVRLLCVLSLDRFGDYVSDQVVAPVRETCAQSLGAVLKYMHPCLVYEVLNILLQMQHRPEWEIRHASLLGIKYLVAVRKEMICTLLDFILPACKSGLGDPDDDVRAVAAEALIPAASFIVSLQRRQLHSIVMLLWDILLDLDDLSPSTSSVMNLLAEIYSHEDMITNTTTSTPGGNQKQEVDLNESVCEEAEEGGNNVEGDPYLLSTLAPRLWPFMRHSITSVRFSAIRTLERLLEAGYRRSVYGSLSTSFWPSYILGDTLRIVFQNFLLESIDAILQCSERVWRLLLQCPISDLEEAAGSYMSSWIELAATPYGSPFDVTKMYWPVSIPRKSHVRAAAKMKIVKLESDEGGRGLLETVKMASSHDANGGEVSSNPSRLLVGSDSDKSVTHTRVVTTFALGVFASKLRVESLRHVIDPLWKHLTSFSGVQRQIASMILISWFRELKSKGFPDGGGAAPDFISEIKNWLLNLLSSTDTVVSRKEALPYSELTRTYYKMCMEASHLLNAVESCGGFRTILSSGKIDIEHMNVDEVINFASKLALKNCDEFVEKCITEDIESSRQQLLTTAGYLKCVQNNLHVTVSALAAAAIVWISDLPAKLNPVILPLMASIKREQEEVIQQKTAEALAELICYCVPRKPGPNDKLIKNLCCLTCIDAGIKTSFDDIEDQDLIYAGDIKGEQKTRLHLLPGGGEDRSRMEGIISRRGSELCLKSLCEKLGSTLFEKLPKLWECLTEVLLPFDCDCSFHTNEIRFSLAIESVQDPQILINNIQIVRCLTPLIDKSLVSRVLNLLPCIFLCVRHSITAVRLSASRCITSMAKISTANVMEAVIERAIPMLEDSSSVNARQGAGMLISYLVRGLGIELVSFSPLLVVPLLRCMSDSDTCVRKSVTHSFAALVPLLPLARGIQSPTGNGKSLLRNVEDALFLEQLLDNTHIEDYKLATDLKVTLRRYQQEGINWLAFLRRFKLHGILCDDMGLGKTLQATAIVATDIVEHRSRNDNENPPMTLIICPTTLVGHWDYEIEKYIDSSVISPLQYVGSVQERALVRASFDKHNVIITSYDVVRKDIDFLSEIRWNFCILDEGHIIKNAKSKITSAVRCLKSRHRLILSGTPIQNNILDLWSLFDFLMPGFLGSERQFQATYGKPLLASRDPKCSAKDAEAGALAVEALHKQVMPFLLRRTKDEVLSDLPEKIIQDRYCDLSLVQAKLYEQFSGFRAQKEISTLVGIEATSDSGERNNKASSHVFQAIQYLLKLCSHPLLVTGEKLPESLTGPVSEVLPEGADIIPELHRIQHSPKLVALQEILEECGVGVDPTCSETSVTVGQHRVLIFAQHKAFLDIIERDLFHTHMKSVTYLRLDGSVESEKRFEIVKVFNSDPTIDVLLLTTHVGGLGLNLSSADTLIFMEHDWNPMRDHQAMDRAHRLGQRKVVNVHRLIMRGTLEEKVMSLQRFKLSVANSVINAENASLKTMNTDQLLDLFTPAAVHPRQKGEKKSAGAEGEAGGRKKGVKGILSGLSELWEQSQYTEEYDLTHFLRKLEKREG